MISRKRTLLHKACIKDDISVIKSLVGSVTIDSLDKNRRTPLFFAHSKAAVDLLVSAGANVNACDTHGFTPLCLARDISVVDALLSGGATVTMPSYAEYSREEDSNSETSRSVLMRMVRDDAPDDVTERIANISKVVGENYLYRARSERMVRLLLRLGVDANGCSIGAYDIRYPLFSPLARRNAGVTKILLDSGARPNVTHHWAMYYGCSPLHLSEHPDVATELLKHGADPYKSEKRENLTPAEYAREAGFPTVAQRIEEFISAEHKRISDREIAEHPSKSSKSDGLCVVCMESQARVVLLPCKHMAMCVRCNAKVCTGEKGKCPLCRTLISSTMIAILP